MSMANNKINLCDMIIINYHPITQKDILTSVHRRLTLALLHAAIIVCSISLKIISVSIVCVVTDA